jgi:hypothetical protein
MRTRSSRAASIRASAGMTLTSHVAVARRSGWWRSVSSSHHPVTREVHRSGSERRQGTRCRVCEELLRRVQPPHRSPVCGAPRALSDHHARGHRPGAGSSLRSVPYVSRKSPARSGGRHPPPYWRVVRAPGSASPRYRDCGGPDCRLVETRTWPDLSGWRRNILRVATTLHHRKLVTIACGARPRRTQTASCRHSA